MAPGLNDARAATKGGLRKRSADDVLVATNGGCTDFGGLFVHRWPKNLVATFGEDQSSVVRASGDRSIGIAVVSRRRFPARLRCFLTRMGKPRVPSGGRIVESLVSAWDIGSSGARVTAGQPADQTQGWPSLAHWRRG